MKSKDLGWNLLLPENQWTKVLKFLPPRPVSGCRFWNAGISGGGAVAEGLPPRSGTCKIDWWTFFPGFLLFKSLNYWSHGFFKSIHPLAKIMKTAAFLTWESNIKIYMTVFFPEEPFISVLSSKLLARFEEMYWIVPFLHLFAKFFKHNIICYWWYHWVTLLLN